MDKRPELLSGKQHTTLSEGGKATAYIKNQTKNHDGQYGNQKICHEFGGFQNYSSPQSTPSETKEEYQDICENPTLP